MKCERDIMCSHVLSECLRHRKNNCNRHLSSTTHNETELIKKATKHASVATTRYHLEVGPIVNKFEQIYSVCHQISVARGRSPGLMPREKHGVTYHVTYPMMHLMLPNPPIEQRRFQAVKRKGKCFLKFGGYENSQGRTPTPTEEGQFSWRLHEN